MSQLIVRAGEFTFQARFEEALAPKTVAAFRKAMPFESQAIHVRWSGEGVWMPLGDLADDLCEGGAEITPEVVGRREDVRQEVVEIGGVVEELDEERPHVPLDDDTTEVEHGRGG